MSDHELLKQAERLLGNTRELCNNLLVLVDELGELRAFLAFQDERNYPRELMVRMLHAAAHGATDTQLLSIARELATLNC